MGGTTGRDPGPAFEHLAHPGEAFPLARTVWIAHVEQIERGAAGKRKGQRVGEGGLAFGREVGGVGDGLDHASIPGTGAVRQH